MPRTDLPLSGVNVVDFGQYLAGPAVAMILGDLGATVVHIDPPDGPLWPSPANATLNRNKLIIEIDLKTDEGLSKARSLIEQADIVVENFRPGVLRGLGINLSEIRSVRPDLITLSIPGFASDDELRREWRAFESVIEAASGVFTSGILGGAGRELMGVNPSFSPLPMASAYGAMFAASAAVLALQARKMSGRGDHIEVPLASAITEGLAYNSIKIDKLPQRYYWADDIELARRQQVGLPMDLSYPEVQDFMDPFQAHYKCKDGRMIYVVCAGHRLHSKRCLELMGLYDDLVKTGLTQEKDTFVPYREWGADFSLGAFPVPRYWAQVISEKMRSVFATRTSGEWERIFGEGGVPATPHRNLKEWLTDEHALSSGLVVEVDDPEYGPMRQPGPVAWLEENADAYLRPAPRRWVDFEEALSELSNIPRPAAKKVSQTEKRGWLDGVRILDLCNVIAGPHTSYYLARFGADIIKLDATKPLLDPSFTVIYAFNNMRGKRSILVDLKTPRGRRVLEKLVKSVDVIVWNATDRQIERMGLDTDSIKSLNPNAIFCQLDAYSGVRRGPRSNYLGYDNLVQAATGITMRFSDSPEAPEDHAASAGTLDVNGGLGAALGIAAALYHRLNTGRAVRAQTSLSALSGIVQLPFCYDYEGRHPFNEPSGVKTKGYGALARLYQTADSKTLMLNATEHDLQAFVKIKGLETVVDLPIDQRELFVEEAIAKETGDEWVTRFQRADIGAAVCRKISDLRAENSRPADGTPGTHQGSYSWSILNDHPSGHVVTQVDPYAVRPEEAAIYAPASAEKYGTSTRNVLAEYQYESADIQSMIEDGVVSESWSREYLPS